MSETKDSKYNNDNEIKFSPISQILTKALTKKIKKDNGIYFTPFDIIETIYNFVSNIENYEVKTILEP